MISHAALDHMAGREFDDVAAVVLRLADESGCTAYDCEFVAVALQIGVPLVTTEQGMREAFRVTVSLARFGGARAHGIAECSLR